MQKIPSLDPTFTGSEAQPFGKGSYWENYDRAKEQARADREVEKLQVENARLRATPQGVDWNRQLAIFWVFAFCALVAFVLVFAK